MTSTSLVPRPSAASFLFAYVTFEPLSDKLAAALRGININSKSIRVVELLHNRVHFACK